MSARSSNFRAGALRRLGPEGVDLWLTATDLSDDEVAACARLMSPDESARAARFSHPGARLNHVVARALVRTALSHYADVDPRDWSFGADARGKPFVAGPATPPDLRFSLSHADGLVALAVAEGRDVGVDVENVARPVDAIAIAGAAFAPAEAAAIADAPHPEGQMRFFALWTLKEAYLKATGLGIAGGLAGVTFDLASLEPRARLAGADAWRFVRSAPTPKHVLALAVAGTALDLRTVWTLPHSARPSS